MPTIDGLKEPTHIQTMYGQAECIKLINQLGYKQPAGFYMQLLPAAVIAASNIHCVLRGCPPPPGETQWLHRRDSPVSAVCVDGGIK